MARKQTLNKRKKLVGPTKNWDLEKLSKLESWSPKEYLSDPINFINSVTECLVNNDPNGVIEMIEIYLRAVDTIKFAKKAKIARSTLYSSLKDKNPKLKTLAKIIHAAAA